MAVQGFQLDDAAFLSGVHIALADFQVESAQAVNQAGEQAAAIAQRLAPKETGELASSIQSTSGRDNQGPYADVGADVRYATYVEFGTSKMRPQPFLRPALEQAVGNFSF